MKKIFRLVSPKILEVYSVQRSGKLSLLNVQEPTPKNSSKIRHLLISSDYSNWDTTQIENVAYKPNHDSNIFGSKSLLRNEHVVLTEPFYNLNTQYWAQAWTPKDSLNSVWKLTSKKTVVFPEALNISASDDNKCWQSGPLHLKYSKETGFSSILPETMGDQEVSKTLEGFFFSPNVKFERRRSKNSFSVALSSITFLACATFVWNYSLQETVNAWLKPPIIYENQLKTISIFRDYQNHISDGSLSSVEFDQRKGAMTLIFVSGAEAKGFRNKIMQLQNRKGAPKLQINKDTVILTVEVPK